MTDLIGLIDHAARLACTGSWWAHSGVDAATRFEIAWSACAESAARHMHDNDGAPPAHASLIVQDGLRALGRESWHIAHDRGAAGNARGHRVYWADACAGTGPADRSVSGIALRQVLADMTDRHREAIETVAATGSIALAADALDIPYGSMARLFRDARIAFYRRWFEGVEPPAPPQSRVRANRKTHCVRGHARTIDNVDRSGSCRECTRLRDAHRRVASSKERAA